MTFLTKKEAAGMEAEIKRLSEIVDWLALHVINGKSFEEAPESIKRMKQNQRDDTSSYLSSAK